MRTWVPALLGAVLSAGSASASTDPPPPRTAAPIDEGFELVAPHVDPPPPDHPRPGVLKDGFLTRFGEPTAPPPPGADQPFRGEVRAFWRYEPFPTAYAPMPDGNVMLLDGYRRKLVVMDGPRIVAEHFLHDPGAPAPKPGEDPGEAPGFAPHVTELVDLVLGPDGVAYLLDATAGAVWAVGPSGKVQGRHGLFLAPTDLGWGADGQLYVRDPGNQSVVGMGAAHRDPYSRRGVDHWPAATTDSQLPFLRIREEGVLVGLVPARPGAPAATILTRLEAPEGRTVIDAEVVGVTDRHVVVQTDVWAPGDERPRSTLVDRVAYAGEDRGQASRTRLPPLPSYCMDCGRNLRLGPDGSLWTFVTSQRGYEVVRFDLEERAP